MTEHSCRGGAHESRTDYLLSGPLADSLPAFIAPFLPLITLPQVIFLGWLLNRFF